MITQKTINQTYTQEAKHYDAIMMRNANFQAPRKTLFENLKFEKGEKILELPVGTGLNLPLYPTNVRVTALDINQEMMKYAIEKSTLETPELQTCFLQGNAESLPFQDNTFDKAIITYGLSAIPSQKKHCKNSTGQ